MQYALMSIASPGECLPGFAIRVSLNGSPDGKLQITSAFLMGKPQRITPSFQGDFSRCFDEELQIPSQRVTGMVNCSIILAISAGPHLYHYTPKLSVLRGLPVGCLTVDGDQTRVI